MSYHKTVKLLEDVLKEYPDLTTYELGEIIYELTADCYKCKPVDIETFIKDDYYLGKTMGGLIFPFWMDFLKRVYPHPTLTMYNEIALSCATGSGKTAVATLSLVYEVYKLLCLKDPHDYYKLANNDKFSFSMFAPTQGQAASVAFTKLLGYFSNSDYFREMKAVPRAKSSVSEEGVSLNDFILINTGSSLNQALGKATFSAVIDEVAYFQGKDPAARAKELHIGLRDRRRSRFPLFGEMTPGIIWLVSSPKDEEDYLNEAIEKIKTNPWGAYFENIHRWDVHGNRGGYSGYNFKLFLGDEKRDPCVMDDESLITPDMLNRSLILDVPVEHKRDFEDNIIRSIRDIAGIRVQADTSLFKSKEKVRNLFINPNRFKNDTISMSFTDPNDKMENYVTNLDYFKKPLHPNSYRFIHLDIATKKDRFGFASVYSTLEDVQLMEPTPQDINRKNIVRKERMFYVDFAVGIEAKKGEEINIFKVMDFIFLLRKLGYPIKMVTSDIFQGDVTRQFLRLNGTETSYLSVDRTKDPYYSLRELINTSRILGVRNELLIKELLGLRDLEKKIDHLSNSCFTGDTKIKLLDGTSKTFEELSSLGVDNKFWVYGCLPDGTIVPALAQNAHVTKEVNKLAIVHLDNGESVKCTVDHRFMVRDGSYKEAQFLTKGDSLMPLYTKQYNVKYKNGSVGSYLQVKNNKTGKYNLVHRLVASHELGRPLLKDEIVHHYDFNPRNNIPTNLKVMSISEHNKKHAFLNGLGRKNIKKRIESFKHNYWSCEENIKKRQDKIDAKVYRQSEEYKKQRIYNWLSNDNVINGTKKAGMKLNNIYWKSEEGKKRKTEVWKYQQHDLRKGHTNYYNNLAMNRIAPYVDYILSYQHAVFVAGGYIKAWEKRLDSISFSTNAEKLRGKSEKDILKLTGLTSKRLKIYLSKLGKLDILEEYNHKVMFVEIVTLEKPLKVYDITVPYTNNFALDSGIFVHNSKDIADALTGSLYSCINSKEYRNNYNIYNEIVKKDNQDENYGELSKMMRDGQKKQFKDSINKYWNF